jgi:hypothetical protein
MRTINPEVLPPEEKALPATESPKEKTLQDYFMEGFNATGSNSRSHKQESFQESFYAEPNQNYSAYSSAQTVGPSVTSEIFTVLSKVSEHKGRVFLAILASFSVLFGGSVIVARNSADLRLVRAASLETATGAVGAGSAATLLFVLVAKLPKSEKDGTN